MKNYYLPYKIALLLKKKGFNEKCFGLWIKVESREPKVYNDRKLNSKTVRDDSCSAPIHQQALDWLLEKHNLDIHAHKMWHYSYNCEEKRMETFYQVSVCDFTIDREARDAHGDRIYQKYISSTLLKTYKEAIEDGITWALKHIK